MDGGSIGPGNSIPEIIIYIVFLLCAAYFAAAESAFSSMNRVRVQLMADEGDKKAKKAIKVLNKFDKALTTLLIGTNIAHIGCASLSTVIALNIWGNTFGEGTVASYATVVTTIIVFLCSEMIPKSYAKANAEKTACAIAGSLSTLMKLFTPIAFVFQTISKFFTNFFPSAKEPTYSEEELVTLIESVEEEGVIDEDSSDILQSAIEFSSTTVKDVMTVRDDIEAIEVHTQNDRIKDILVDSKHSRVPVYDTTLDRIIGVMNVRTFLKTYISKSKFNIRTILSKPYPAKADSPIDELFDRMRSGKIYMAVVKDDNGRTLGVATIEDFLEEIVGEIWDEDDEVNENFIKLGGYSYEISGKMNVGEAFMQMKYKPQNPAVMAKSVQIWISEILGHMPEEDESFVYENALDVCITEVENGNINKIEVKILSDEEKQEILSSAADDTTSDKEAVRA